MIPFFKPIVDYNKIETNIKEIFTSGQLTNWGKYVDTLENKVSEYLERPAILVACGTHALTFSLLALAHLKTIPKNAKILVPSFTFYASIHAIIWAGMVPVFCDIYPDTFTMNLSTATDDYDAIMPINIFGAHYTTKEFMSLDKPIIGDNSHGFGGSMNNIKNGTWEDIACFSTSITKPFQTIEGGIIASNKEVIAFIKNFRNWGSPHGLYDCVVVGQWSKITEINALTGLYCLNHLEESINIKNEIAQVYKNNLSGIVEFQHIPQDTKTTYKDFAILFEDSKLRNKISDILTTHKIGNKKYFYPPVHKMNCFYGMYDKLNLPITNNIADRVLCLPIYDTMSEKELVIICNEIKKHI